MTRSRPVSLLAVLLVACGTGGSAATSSATTATSVPAPTSASTGSARGSILAGCRILPDDNPWNLDVSRAPLDAALTATVDLRRAAGVHPDWGMEREHYGIPITVGRAAAPRPIRWTTGWGPTESDPLACPGGRGAFCYPIPRDAKIEGGPGAAADADRHVLFLATDGAPDRCTLYELFQVGDVAGPQLRAGSGAIFHLESNALRQEGWTSADAAGLPILPGLVRRDEVAAGVIRHALRFTMARTRHAYIHPATHAAGTPDPSLPPMGMRVRLRASFDESRLGRAAKIVTTAMKTYGMILSDNGSDWYVTGESSDAWGPEMDDLVASLGSVRGSDFEIVKTGEVILAKR